MPSSVLLKHSVLNFCPCIELNSSNQLIWEQIQNISSFN